MDRKAPLNIAISTLGCKTNQSDAASLAADLRARGCLIVSFKELADVYIIFTCTVTAKTDYQSRQLVRRALTKNPQAQIIVTGCYAQVAPKILGTIPGVDFIVGVADEPRIPELIGAGKKNKEVKVFVSSFPETFYTPPRAIPFWGEHTRAFLKIQDGCNSFCTYCIVPYARGRSRSLPLRNVLNKVDDLWRAGFREIVLTGIHLGIYGEDLEPPQDLLALLPALENFAGEVRFRLSSLEPTEISLPLINFLAKTRKICPHLHIPLQSGDDKILQKMRRPYTASFYAQLLYRLQKAIPDLAVGTDVICGFPGEDEQAFQNTRQLLADLPLAYLHIFPYSPRPGTPAASLPDQVPSPLIKERGQILRELSEHKKNLFYRSFAGRVLPVLVEGKGDRERGLWKGYSPNYIPIIFPGEEGLINQEVPVKVETVQGTRVFGKIIKKVS
ncbi:MAG: tRNA (N(6)-L-threonylcarbamoyladenosine(37)-C(2))-methylthiotransferase MtaB [Thermodesulfobacteriota bacterium]